MLLNFLKVFDLKKQFLYLLEPNKLIPQELVRTMTPDEKKKYIKHEHTSVVRKKAKKMENSRDSWKEKNQEKQDSIKALKARMIEKEESRDSWKLKNLKNAHEAEVYKEKAQVLEQELIKERIEKECLLREIEELKKKLRRSLMS